MAITKKALAAQQAKKEAEKEQSVKTFIGINKVEGGWEFSKIKTQGDKVIDVDATDPTLRAFCFEELKIRAVQEFLKEV